MGRRSVTEVLEDPLLVVLTLELQQGLPQVFDRLEGPHPQEVLLEGPDEPFGAAVAFGLADEGRGTRDAPRRRIRAVAALER